MAVLYRLKLLDPVYTDDNYTLLPGSAGHNDVGSAFRGSVNSAARVALGERFKRVSVPVGSRSMPMIEMDDGNIIGASDGPKWLIRPGSHPTTGAVVTGAWSARMYYQRAARGASTAPTQNIAYFRNNGNNAMIIEAYGYYNSEWGAWRDELQIRGLYWNGSSWKNFSGGVPNIDYWSVDAVHRIELQVDQGRTTDVVMRVYVGDGTVPWTTQTVTSLPTSGSNWTDLTIGWTTPANTYNPINRLGHLEIHDDYTLGGQFTGTAAPASPTPAATNYTGSPSTNETYEARFNVSSGATTAAAASYTEYLDLNYTTANTYGRLFDLYVPNATPPVGGWPVVIWCHSGYFTEGSRKDLPAAWRNDLLNAGYAVATVDYVLSGKLGETYGDYDGNTSKFVGGRYPSHVIDLKRAGAYLRDNALTYNIDSTKFITAGYSAGGYVALSALVTKDVEHDNATAYGASENHPLTIAGATAASLPWGDGYTGTDPSFLGAVMYNSVVDMDAAHNWDPGFPDSFTGITTAHHCYFDSNAANVDMLDPPAPTLKPYASVQNLLQLNGAHAVTTLYIRGTADYLIHWEHPDLLLEGLTSIGEEDYLTIVDEPTVHIQSVYDKNVVIDFLDALTVGNSAYFEVPTPIGVSVHLPSATVEGNGSGVPGIFDVPELQVDVKSAGPTGSADLPISTFGQDPPTIFDAPVIGVGVSTLGVEATGGGAPGGIFEAEAPIAVAARISPVSAYVSPPIILPPTSPLGSDVAPAPVWTIKLYPPGSNTPSGMIAASAKTIELNLTEPSTGEFAVSGFDTTTNLIEEFITDAVWTRDDRDMLRCRIGGSNDTIDADKHMVTFTGADYRALLDRRYLTSTISTTAAPDEQFDIVWDMISQTQTALGGNLGLAQHPQWQASGVSRGDVWEVGRSIGQAITEMGQRRTIDGLYGFDWDVNPDLTMQMFTPNRGYSTGFTIEYGTNCDQVKRTVSSTDYANYVATQWTDKDGIERIATANSTDLVTRPEGRWEYWEGGSWATTGEGNAFAGGKLALMQGILPSYECRLLVNTWDPTRCWLGDVVGLVIQSGRLNVRPPVGLYRVQKIRAVIGDSGNEEVTITLGNPSYKVASRLWLLGRSVSELERR